MPKGLRILHLSLGERNLTHFGGIYLIHQFCKKLRLKWYLQKQVRFPQRSSYYHPVELILAILYALIAGIPRLSKTKILQGNGAFQQIIGLKKFPYASSLRRFLKRINPKTIQSINRVHDHLRLKMFYLPKPRTSLLFDFDSSVLTLYGKFIEGAEVGYNPHKRGARSYHPLLCFEYHSRDFWHGLLRPGNVDTSSGGPEFLKQCLGKVPPGVYRIRLRADSGFFDHKFIEPLDQEGIGYVIVAKMTRPIRNKVGTLRYYRFKKNWGAAEFFYKPFRWKEPHRFVVIRRPLPEKDSEQLVLFTLKHYSYQIFVTTLSQSRRGLVFLSAQGSDRGHYQGTERKLRLGQDSNQQFSSQSVLFPSPAVCLQSRQLVQEDLSASKISECNLRDYSDGILSPSRKIGQNRSSEFTQIIFSVSFQGNLGPYYPEYQKDEALVIFRQFAKSLINRHSEYPVF